MPGNYARALFDLENSEKILAIIPNSSRREALIEILSKFRRIRKVYRCNWPLEECPEEVYSFKENAIQMGQLIKKELNMQGGQITCTKS